VADRDQKIWELKFFKLVESQLFNTLNKTANKLLTRSKRIEMGVRIYTMTEIRLVILKLKILIINKLINQLGMKIKREIILMYFHLIVKGLISLHILKDYFKICLEN